MPFVGLHGVSVAYGDRDVLQNVSLTIDTNSRIALAGDNGSGKTTLLRIAAGLDTPGFGSVQRKCVTGYLPQSGLIFRNATLLEEADRAFERYHAVDARKSEIEETLSGAKDGDAGIDALLEEHDKLLQALLRSGFYDRLQRVRSVLIGLGFDERDFQKKTHEFSGGWQMRIGLAKVLLADPDIVLLDEPTNYLDIEARTWLEEFLASFRGGAVLVSHDRYFLDVMVREVAELFRGELKIYPGNYTTYADRRAQELDALYAAHRQQQAEIERMELFIRRFRAKPTKAAQVQSRIKQLEKLSVIEIPPSLKRIAFRFPDAPHSGKIVLRAEAVGRSYGDLDVLRDVEFVLERGDKMVIVGRNGAGKSTLMRILAQRDTENTGTIRLGSEVRIGYFSQDLDSIPASGSVLEAVEAVAATDDIPRLRDLLGGFLFRGDDVHKSVTVLSGGERSRLALLTLLLHPVNLLILDEPTNHLDMASKKVLLSALEHFAGTLVFVSHDRYFIEAVADRVLELKETEWTLFPGDYKYYLWRLSDGPDNPRERSKAVGLPAGRSVGSAGSPASALADGSFSDPARGPTGGRPVVPTGGRPGSGAAPRGIEDGPRPETNAQGSDSRTTHKSTRPFDRDEEKEVKRRVRRLERREAELLPQIEANEIELESCNRDLSLKENYSDGVAVARLTAVLRSIEAERERLSTEWDLVDTELRQIRERRIIGNEEPLPFDRP